MQHSYGDHVVSWQNTDKARKSSYSFYNADIMISKYDILSHHLMNIHNEYTIIMLKIT